MFKFIKSLDSVDFNFVISRFKFWLVIGGRGGYRFVL